MTNTPPAGSFLGASADVLQSLGKLVIVSGRIEQCAIDLGEIFSVDRAHTLPIGRLLKELRKRSGRWGVPPWSSASATDVESWTLSVEQSMDRRNQVFHAAHLMRADEVGSHAEMLNHRTGDPLPADHATFESLATELSNRLNTGGRILLTYMHQVKTGVYIRNEISPTGRPIVIQDAGNDANMPRVTDDEINSYWNAWESLGVPPRWPPRNWDGSLSL